MALLRDRIVQVGLANALDRLGQSWFQTEFLGEENLPTAADGPRLLVMNHTAFFALEMYLLGSRLLTRNPEMDLRTLVWAGFSEGPLGLWFRNLGCETASVETGIRLLEQGKTVVIMPEGVGATDVRRPFNRFRTGYLHILKHCNVPVVPIGFYGVDEAMPWLVMHNRFLEKHLMHPVDPSFDFLLFPRLPVLRPTKIVFSVGETLHIDPQSLVSPEGLVEENRKVQHQVMSLVEQARIHRRAQIDASFLNRWFHRLVEGPNIRYAQPTE